MKDSPNVELIENKGPNNMRDELRRFFNKASRVDIAVAFINMKGLSLVLNEITKILSKANSRVRILTRISKDAFNEPSALRTLLNLSKDYEGRAEARITKITDSFHEKMYLCSTPKSSTVFIGSSNLTDRGLTSEGEINVKIISSRSSDIAKQAAENFETCWNDADELIDEVVDSYTSFYRHVHSKGLDERSKRLWYKVSRLSRKRRPKKVSTPEERRIWLDYVDCNLSKKTQRIIEEYTTWDKFGYYSCGLRSFRKCNRNDILILADHKDKTLSANYIRDKTRIATPDGRYFIAFKQIRSSKLKRITKNFLSTIKQDGLIGGVKDLKPSSARTLSPEKTEYLCSKLNFK